MVYQTKSQLKIIIYQGYSFIKQGFMILDIIKLYYSIYIDREDIMKNVIVLQKWTNS